MKRQPDPTATEVRPDCPPATPVATGERAVEPHAVAETFEKPPSDATRSYLLRNLVYLVIGVVVLVGLAYLAQQLLGARLAAVSRLLTNTAGYPGVFLSIFLIDTFTLPVSPDVILAFVAHHGSALHAPSALVVICLASIAAGNTGYRLAGWLAGTRFVKKRLAKSFDKGHALFERYGVWSVVIAGLTPVPFSVVCWFAGLYKMAPWPLFLATLSRIPRFIGWFYLLRLGFSL